MAQRPSEERPPLDPAHVHHELELHMVELEIQNEELQLARTAAESALQRFTALFELAPVGYLVVDPHGIVREANLRASAMLGAPRGAIVGSALTHYLGLDEQVTFTLFLQRVLIGTGSASCELTRDAVRLELVGSPYDVGERQALIALHDITPLRTAERELRAEGQRKNEFINVLSHELRNPLAPMRTALAVLAHAEPGGKHATKSIEVIARQLDHLVQIVDDLLDVARIERGKLELRPEPLELGTIIEQALDDHLPTFEANGIRLERSLEDEPFWIHADRTRIVQVVTNLLGNAAKFTPSGGRVEVTLRRHGGRATCTVRDDGIGIAPAMLHRIFEPFVQEAQELARTRGGLGLGLATVKALVELQGGSVTASSEGIGRGALFEVTLPLISRPLSKPAVTQKKPRGRLRPRRVLVIEDRTSVAEGLRLFLAEEGHEAAVAHDGPSGIALARQFCPDVILCDLGLPGMDGYEVARTLRADAGLRDVYLVALSGYATPHDRERARLAGFDRHLAKPASHDALMDALASASARPSPEAGTGAL